MAVFATGVGAFAVGSGWNVYVSVAHGIAGFVIVALAPWKTVIARRGYRHVRPGRSVSLMLALGLVAALVFGFLHSTGLARSLGAVTAMQLHVGAALVSLPLVVWHTIARPARPHRSDLERRNLIRTAMVTAGGAAAYALLSGAEQIAGLAGSRRRFTGSYERGTGNPTEMPVTQWLNDRVPVINASEWTLKVGERRWTYDELAAFDTKVDGLIDCTGGWFATQRWEGVLLSDLLRGADTDQARSIVVRSTTGYSRTYPWEDASKLLLATRIGGVPLTPGHGYPARIVAPGRRGFWWVKWVQEIEVSSRPWWLQPPFPLT